VLVLLFTTGLATMGMELIWIRLFTPYIGPVVYSFGMILVAYLLASIRDLRFIAIGAVRESTKAG